MQDRNRQWLKFMVLHEIWISRLLQLDRQMAFPDNMQVHYAHLFWFRPIPSIHLFSTMIFPLKKWWYFLFILEHVECHTQDWMGCRQRKVLNSNHIALYLDFQQPNFFWPQATLMKPISDCLTWHPLPFCQQKLSLKMSSTVCFVSISC